MIARSPASLEAAAEAIRATSKGTVASLALDITSADAVERLDAALTALGTYPDLLVNNAGVGLGGPFVAQDQGDIADLIALNVAAMTRLFRHVLPGQLARGRGGVINVASLGGVTPGPNQAAYYASKAYILSLSEAVSAEVTGMGVRITCVIPGPIDTGFHAGMGAQNALYRRLLPDSTPDAVTAWAMAGYAIGVRVVAPGLLAAAFMLALRVLPHRLTTPVIRTLLDPGPPTSVSSTRPK